MARESYWEVRDAATALTQFPRRRTLERHLLKGLAEREPLNDLLGALNFVCVFVPVPSIRVCICKCVSVCMLVYMGDVHTCRRTCMIMWSVAGLFHLGGIIKSLLCARKFCLMHRQ